MKRMRIVAYLKIDENGKGLVLVKDFLMFFQDPVLSESETQDMAHVFFKSTNCFLFPFDSSIQLKI